ncbi:hypothetical protein EXIGLDRAFT_151208 [Exidia glandulosa HHB12029]|uniref:Uncharacterized protein n=1 Tax=Exidia glandulosa HHB12029 TaxID=1314781 RepID=A0A165FL21_EXIGL|nr:hypothetical protein EXIGLDRAFT_151208 [Exidia glandulosa HHB12029]
MSATRRDPKENRATGRTRSGIPRSQQLQKIDLNVSYATRPNGNEGWMSGPGPYAYVRDHDEEPPCGDRVCPYTSQKVRKCLSCFERALTRSAGHTRLGRHLQTNTPRGSARHQETYQTGYVRIEITVAIHERAQLGFHVLIFVSSWWSCSGAVTSRSR